MQFLVEREGERVFSFLFFLSFDRLFPGAVVTVSANRESLFSWPPIC